MQVTKGFALSEIDWLLLSSYLVFNVIYDVHRQLLCSEWMVNVQGPVEVTYPTPTHNLKSHFCFLFAY